MGCHHAGRGMQVQFSGEDGIDEGGVQKEFFQLIMSQVIGCDD